MANWTMIAVFLVVLMVEYGRFEETTNKSPVGPQSKRSRAKLATGKGHKRQQKSSHSTLGSSIKLYNLDEPDFDYKLSPSSPVVVPSSTTTTVINQQQQANGDYTNENYYDAYNLGGQLTDQVTTAQRANSNSKYTFTVNLTAVLGHNIVLPCAVRNLGVHNILWLRVKDGDVLAYDDNLITHDPRFKLMRKTSNESNLLIEGVRSSDSGEYVCQINTYNVKSKFINLVVLTPPAFSDPSHSNGHNLADAQHQAHLALTSSHVTSKHSNHLHHNHKNHMELDHSSTKSIDVVEGKQLNLECNAFGQPKPITNWYVKRYKSDNITVYSLNTSRISVNNVLRKQYDYFECEATNRVPPSISKKFKINVLYRPEIVVNPPKVYVYTMPTQVKFNCTVNAYPDASIVWMFNNIDLREPFRQRVKKMRQAYREEKYRNKGVGSRYIKNNFNNNNVNVNVDQLHRHGRNLAQKATDNASKYRIMEHALNETSRMSSIVINVENEHDLGVYECFANNTAGSKTIKFYIYGESKTQSASNNSTPSVQLNVNNQTVAIDVYNEEIIITGKDYSLNDKDRSGSSSHYENNIHDDEHNVNMSNERHHLFMFNPNTNLSNNLMGNFSSSSSSVHKSNDDQSAMSFIQSIFGSTSRSASSAASSSAIIQPIPSFTLILLSLSKFTLFFS